MTKLKPIDKKILHVMQEESLCVPQVSKIAQRLDVPTSTIHARVKRLQEIGAIRGYTPILNPEQMGKGFVAFLLAQCNVTKDIDLTGRELVGIPGVQEIFRITGDWDYILKIKVKDQEEFNSLINELNKKLGKRGKGIISTKTLKESSFLAI